MAHEDGTWKAVGDFIRRQRQLANMSLRQLSELAQVSNPYLSQIERGLYRPSANVLKGIANALQLSAETLYAKAGFLDEAPQTQTSVEIAIRLDPGLSDDQKDTLLRVYRGFVGEN